MIVTDVIEVNKSRAKIYLDGAFAFVLYKGEMHKYGIQKGAELSQSLYDILTKEILPKRAKLRAMNLLTKRPYTEAGLRRKLSDGMYPESCIDAAIAYVKSYGYIDDAAYARDFIASRADALSQKQIEIKLLQRGIAKDIVHQACDELLGGHQEELELEQIQSLFQRRYHGIVPAQEKERAKMMQFFLRRGYTPYMVAKAVNMPSDTAPDFESL